MNMGLNTNCKGLNSDTPLVSGPFQSRNSQSRGTQLKISRGEGRWEISSNMLEIRVNFIVLFGLTVPVAPMLRTVLPEIHLWSWASNAEIEMCLFRVVYPLFEGAYSMRKSLP